VNTAITPIRFSDLRQQTRARSSHDILLVPRM
jgi:hypothetical protein